jgi:flagellar biosynthesis component FlhA
MMRREASGAKVSGTGNDFGRITGASESHQVAAIDYDRDEDAIQLHLDGAVLYRVFRGNPGKFITAWREARNQFLTEIGILLPDIDVKVDSLAPPSSYRVVAAGTEMFSGTLSPDSLFIEMCRTQAAPLGLEVLSSEVHPISGHKVFWTPNRPHVWRQLEAGGIPCRDFFDFITLKVCAFALSHPAEFLSVTAVHSMLRGIEKRHPGLVGEGFGREFVSAPKLTEILQELVRQGVSIRDFRAMLEGVASYCSAAGVTLDSEQTIDVSAAVAHVRMLRRRQMIKKILGPHRSLRVISLSPDLEEALDGADFEGKGLPLPLGLETLQVVELNLARITKPINESGVHPVVVLCRSDLREKVSSLIHFSSQRAFIIGVEELEPSQSVEQVGVWSLEHR